MHDNTESVSVDSGSNVMPIRRQVDASNSLEMNTTSAVVRMLVERRLPSSYRNGQKREEYEKLHAQIGWSNSWPAAFYTRKQLPLRTDKPARRAYVVLFFLGKKGHLSGYLPVYTRTNLGDSSFPATKAQWRPSVRLCITTRKKLASHSTSRLRLTNLLLGELGLT